jgi:hypothetical protein
MPGIYTGISHRYDTHDHIPVIYQVYTTDFQSMGIPDASCGCGGTDPSLSHCHGHLESVEVGYSDIFLEYSIYLTTRSICLEYSDIYLECVNPFPIPGICLEYA